MRRKRRLSHMQIRAMAAIAAEGPANRYRPTKWVAARIAARNQDAGKILWTLLGKSCVDIRGNDTDGYKWRLTDFGAKMLSQEITNRHFGGKKR